MAELNLRKQPLENKERSQEELKQDKERLDSNGKCAYLINVLFKKLTYNN